ncbi:MAG: Rieske (2Fe-2S) protein [Persicimonas sp.]
MQELLNAGYTKVCTVDDIPQMMPRKVSVDGRSVLLCRDAGEIYAIDEICPHKQKSMAYGVVHAGKIICPHHQYEFELDTGRCRRKRCAPVLTYEVEVVDTEVFVKAG